MGLITLYLAAIVAANLLVAIFGPSISIINAFLFIGFDLTARDALHERWGSSGLWWKMMLLILTGSVLSWLLNSNAGSIAVASFVAFAAAGVSDAAIYQRLILRPRMIRMNGSNVVSAGVDSLIFPAIAFGFPLMWPIVIGQFLSKTLGGALWSIVINRNARRGDTA